MGFDTIELFSLGSLKSQVHKNINDKKPQICRSGIEIIEKIFILHT